jgi:hypothetical protein
MRQLVLVSHYLLRPGETLPFSANVYSLLSASDGTLWIGTSSRLFSLKDNKVEEHVRGRINTIVEDRKHRIGVRDCAGAGHHTEGHNSIPLKRLRPPSRDARSIPR